jgi:hypothetical protein
MTSTLIFLHGRELKNVAWNNIPNYISWINTSLSKDDKKRIFIP